MNIYGSQTKLATKTFDQRQQEFWNIRTNVRSYDHPIVIAFAKQRVQFIQKILSYRQFSCALDVGCGDGFGMQHMKCVARRLYGCDTSLTMLEGNPTNKKFLSLASAYALPYEEGSFELVYCWELLHHIERPEKVLEEMNRVSSKCVLVCEPNSFNVFMALFGISRPEERGTLRFNPLYVRKLLRDIGLQNVRTYSVSCFTPNRTPLWLKYVLEKLPYEWPFIGLYNIAIGHKQ